MSEGLKFEHRDGLNESQSFPLVSVVVPNYNHARYLSERLDSVFGQTYSNFEVLLLDDSSTDESLKIFKQYQGLDNVSVIANEVNSGTPFAQWNLGVKHAKGDFIWIAESDDVAEKTFLEECLPRFKLAENIGIVDCNILRISEEGEVLSPLTNDAFPDEAERWQNDFRSSGINEIQNYLFIQNILPSASGIIFKRSTYLEAGLADTDLTITGDWWQWVKILLIADRYHVANPLAYSRVHPNNQRTKTASDGRYEQECLIVQRRIVERIPIPKNVLKKGVSRYTNSWTQGVRSLQKRPPLLSHFHLITNVFRLAPWHASLLLFKLAQAAFIAQIKLLISKTS